MKCFNISEYGQQSIFKDILSLVWFAHQNRAPVLNTNQGEGFTLVNWQVLWIDNIDIDQ